VASACGVAGDAASHLSCDAVRRGCVPGVGAQATSARLLAAAGIREFTDNRTRRFGA
jgi:hypothetical protein